MLHGSLEDLHDRLGERYAFAALSRRLWVLIWAAVRHGSLYSIDDQVVGRSNETCRDPLLAAAGIPCSRPPAARPSSATSVQTSGTNGHNLLPGCRTHEIYNNSLTSTESFGRQSSATAEISAGMATCTGSSARTAFLTEATPQDPYRYQQGFGNRFASEAM